MEEASHGRLSAQKPCQIQLPVPSASHCFLIHMDIISGRTLVLLFIATT